VLLKRRAGESIPPPVCVVRPRSTGEVAEVLRWAQETSTAIVPYGGGSGVCGGIAVATGAVVVDLERMDRISALDEESLLVACQAGVRGPDLDAALRASGHMLGHEPQSMGISTVGGWVATRACGQLSARYGGIEDVLVALEAVLPGGKVVRSKATPRRAAGPDVAALMVGSEGSLGIVTEATLQVAPVPDESAHVSLTFDEMSDGVTACRRVAQSDLAPTLVRLYDEHDTAIFFRSHPEPPAGPVLLVTFQEEGASNVKWVWAVNTFTGLGGAAPHVSETVRRLPSAFRHGGGDRPALTADFLVQRVTGTP
jgi:alkyldihydroxyacetonephosphate synthase